MIVRALKDSVKDKRGDNCVYKTKEAILVYEMLLVDVFYFCRLCLGLLFLSFGTHFSILSQTSYKNIFQIEAKYFVGIQIYLSSNTTGQWSDPMTVARILEDLTLFWSALDTNQ